MNRRPRRRVGLVLSLAAAACMPVGRDAPARFEGEWSWLYSRGLYFDSVVRPLPEQQTLLMLEQGEFRLIDHHGTTVEGAYEITDAQVESASGTFGPLLRLSEAPEFLGDADFVLSLKADTLFLLTTLDDFTDYAFVRRESRGGG